MGLVRVTAAEGARGNYVGQRGVILHFDAGSKNVDLRERHVDAKDVPELVKRGLINQPTDEQMNGGEGAEDKGTADALAGAAASGPERGDASPSTTAKITNFPAGHEANADAPGLPGATSAADAEAAAAALDPDDPDAPPKPARRARASASKD